MKFVGQALTTLAVLLPVALSSNVYTDDHWFYRSYSALTAVPRDIPKKSIGVYLNNNYITRLEAHSLAHLSVCTFISFNYNIITRVEPGAFVGLKSVDEMWMAGNKLKLLYTDMFQGLESLESLVLTDNRLNETETGAFRGLSRLRMLYLYGNAFPRITKGMFTGLEILEELVLTNNHISTVNDGSFTGLGNLKILWMDHNGDMTDLRQNAFTGLHRLEQLWLQSNRISSLQVGLFNGLANLQELSLDNNQLTELQPGLFDGLESLTRIWLYNNKLTTLASDLFPNLPRPLELTIGANPLKCDGSLCWLKRLEDQRYVSWITLAGRLWYPKCDDGSTWDNISLTCPNKVECGDPGGVDNAVRGASSWPYTVGTAFTYTCESCYTGGGSITCQENGQWTQRPTCTVITCQTQRTDSSGRLSVTNVTCGTEAFCPEGYEVEGDPRITCGPDGLATVPTPECRSIDFTSMSSSAVTSDPFDHRVGHGSASRDTTNVAPSTVKSDPSGQHAGQEPDTTKLVVIITGVLLIVVAIVIAVILFMRRRHIKTCYHGRKSHSDHFRSENPKVKYLSNSDDLNKDYQPEIYVSIPAILPGPADRPYETFVDTDDKKLIVESTDSGVGHM